MAGNKGKEDISKKEALKFEEKAGNGEGKLPSSIENNKYSGIPMIENSSEKDHKAYPEK